MPQPSYIALELMINKLSEFIERLFGKKEKSEFEKVNELNTALKNEFDLSIFEIIENSFETWKVKIEKVDSTTLNDIISMLFYVSISNNKNQTYQRLKANGKLNEKILELISFTENKFKQLSLESSNAKNSIQQIMKKRTSYNSRFAQLLVLL